MKNKKFLSIVILSVAISMTIGCKNSDLNNPLQKTQKVSSDLFSELQDTTKIDVYHNVYFEEDYKPAVISDKDIINDFLNYTLESVDNSKKELSGNPVKSKMIFYDKNNNKKELKYVYDDLYEFGYVLNGEKRYDLPYDFFRLLAASEKYRSGEATVKQDVKNLFNKYKYKPSFMISSQFKKLPENLKYGYEENIEKIYWSYCMELSKAVGMDFSNLLSNEISAEKYYLLEPLGKFAQEANGIVIRHKGKIVGAYIQGNNDGMVSTLDKKSFEKIKKMKIDTWVCNNILDRQSKLYKESSNRSDLDLIKTYFEAMENKNYVNLLSTMDTKSIIDTLNCNIKNSELYQENIGESLPRYANKINILDIKKSEKDEKTYHVEMDITTSDYATIESGKNVRTVVITEENGVKKIEIDVPGPQ